MSLSNILHNGHSYLCLLFNICLLVLEYKFPEARNAYLFCSLILITTTSNSTWNVIGAQKTFINE